MATRTFYEILGIPHDADDDEIRRAYRLVMQEHHPDQNPDNQRAARRTRYLNAARDALLDPAKRKRYDQKLRRKGILPELTEPVEKNSTNQPEESTEKTEKPAAKTKPSIPRIAPPTDEPEPAPSSTAELWSQHRTQPRQWPLQSLLQTIRQGGWKTGAVLGIVILLTAWLLLDTSLFRITPDPAGPGVPFTTRPPRTPRPLPSSGRVIPRPLAVRTSDTNDEARKPLRPDDSIRPGPSAMSTGSKDGPRGGSKDGSTRTPPAEEKTKRTPVGPQPALLLGSDDAKQAELLQQQWAEWLQLAEQRTNEIGMELTLVPAGRFLSGFPEQARVEQTWPQAPTLQTVNSPFYLSRQPVTREAWSAVMESEPWNDQATDPSAPSAPYATGMSWQEANDFCEKLSRRDGQTYRLPSQQEWEFAWRSGQSPSFFQPDFTWDNASPSGGEKDHPLGLIYAPQICEFCGDFIDETRHISRRPAEFRSSRLGREPHRDKAAKSSTHGFRVLMVPEGAPQSPKLVDSQNRPLPYSSWQPAQSAPDVPPLLEPWVRASDRRKPALVPNEKKREQARNLLNQKIGKLDLESVKGPLGIAQLDRQGRELLRMTRGETDLARLYAKLDLAIDCLTRTQNRTWTDHGIDLLCQHFQVDPLSLQIWVASKWVNHREEERKSLATRVRGLADQAGAVRRYRDQAGLLQLYLELLPENHKQIEPTQRLLETVRQQSDRYRQIMELQERVVQQPDPEQAALLGEYLCFELQDWDSGVPYLAQGPTGQLQQVAQYEMRDHNSADARLWIADNWWKLSETLTEHALPLRARAGQWYRAAYPDLKGEERQRVASTLEELYAKPVEWTLSLRDGLFPGKLIQRGKTAHRKTGLLLYPGSAIALDHVFSSIDSVTIRGRMGGFDLPGKHNFQFQAGPLHAVFNSSGEPGNHFRSLPADPRSDGARLPVELTTPPTLQPGQFHDFKIMRTDRDEIRMTVDGKGVHRTAAPFKGGLMIYATDQPIEIESLSIRGTPDPLSAPNFIKQYNLESVSAQRQ